MTRRLKVPYSLARKRIRASLNKYNVYNALTWRKNRPLSTQFRQVFFAKQESRAYHGDRLTENQFKNHFRGDLPVVSPLQSSRSGDGAEDIPYALQTFVGLERRLDFAVFRSLFASSVRQAAYFILRGSVKVNGVRIKSPGYILRPGDMFSVDPRRVLYALGRSKPSSQQSVRLTNRIIQRFNRYIDACHSHPQKMWRRRQQNRRRHTVYNAKFEARRRERTQKHNHGVQQQMKQALDAVKPVSVLERVLKNRFETRTNMGTVREIQRLVGVLPAQELAKGSTKEPAKEPSKEPTKDAQEPVKESASRDEEQEKHEEQRKQQAENTVLTSTQSSGQTTETTPSVSAEAYYGTGEALPHRSDVKRLVKQLVDGEKDAITAEFNARMAKVDEEPYDPNWLARLPEKLPLVPEDADPESVKVPLPFSTTGGKLYGLSEPKKTWFTPWTPRQFIAPFAILPHHLEVDFETCHSVYLRDPVARPGHSEVISPFNLDMHERAYLWYVYRRRKNLPSLA